MFQKCPEIHTIGVPVPQEVCGGRGGGGGGGAWERRNTLKISCHIGLVPASSVYPQTYTVFQPYTNSSFILIASS